LEVFFASFPKSGKEEAGIALSTQEGPAFGCQIVMVIQLIAGDCCRAEVTAEQIFTEFLIKLIHDRSENLKDLCFRPNPNPPGNPPLPRYDRFTQVPSTSFRKVTPTTWVFADTPRFPAQAVPENGIPIGLPDGIPVERRSLHRGDKLQIIRKWITFFFGTCEPPTSTSISEVSISPMMAAVLLFYVRWSCAHEMTAAADPAEWTGRRIAGKPVHPEKFPTIPEPLHGDAARDYQDANGQRSQAQQSQPETGAVDSFRPFECPD
jgi:hypothetical protein